MKFFGLFDNKKEKSSLPVIQAFPKRITGKIAYYQLLDWWLDTFSEEEQHYIDQKYKPLILGGQGNGLLSGEISSSSASVVNFLWVLADWFNQKEELSIAKRILEKAETLVLQGNLLDQHFLYATKLKIYYKHRENPEFFELAIQACRQQIAIAEKAKAEFIKEAKNLGDKSGFFPSHSGYEQLAIILEKQKDFEEAIKIAKQAQDQGWAGDWQKRIDRCTKKLIKSE